MMQALVFKRYGKTSQPEYADIPRPALGPNDLLVRVHAVGLNPIDTMIPKGTFKPVLSFDLPATVGSDVAGVVVEVGRSVTRFAVGDAIYASVFDLNRGALADFVAVPERVAALKPASLDFNEAASIPMVGLTSWQALKERAKLQRGQKIFIPAGSGGIGTFAIQLAKHIGARVATTTSTGNVELVRSLGADEVIDYRKLNFETTIRDCDLVLGTVRGGNLEKSLHTLKRNGVIVSLVGPLDAAFAQSRRMNPFFHFLFRLMSRKIIRLSHKNGVHYSFLFVRPDGEQLAEIGKIIDEGGVRPVIDRVFPFDQAQEALRYLATGRAKGKVVVQRI